ncbi:MAG: protoporphyrinogen oxidase, partial [Candidatus Hydrogenedentes bacterium]|nr:protoporphyrinogen oxidase [Candidatus Hydrogenedentota bacterium]
AAHRFILRHGRLHEVQGPPKFLLSSLLSLSGRARLLCEPFIPGKRDSTPESIWNFAARRIGREAADTLVSPMVSGIFGGDARQLSLEHCFPRMAAMERQYGGLYKALRAKRRENPGASPMGPSGTLTCFPRGIQQLCDTAAAQLGDRLRCNTPVTAVHEENGQFRIELNNGEAFLTKKLLVAAPAYAAAQFLAPLDEALAQTLGTIPYASIAVLCTAHGRSQVAHPLNGFGFLAPRVEGVRTLGCLWTSSIFPQQAPLGKVLLRTMIGGATDPAAVNLSEAELLDLLQREIGPLLGITGQPELIRVFRWQRGIPQYDLQHGPRLDALAAAQHRHPNLALAGNAYHGVGLNDCVLSAHAAVERLT